MLKVFYPENCAKEKEYILSTLIGDYLGVEYELFPSKNASNYSLQFEGKEIIIKDTFFKNKQHTELYSKENTPKEIIWEKVPSEKEKIPVLYGTGKIGITEGEINCSIDIFASCFFMLTRWEETLPSEKDKYNRFLAKNSLAFQANFLHQPIVDKYVRLLKHFLEHFNCPTNSPHKFKVYLTHDVDRTYMWDNPMNLLYRINLHRRNKELPKLPWEIKSFTKRTFEKL